ncbi:hypothetical protein A1O3_03954 [Capronia epimyces CBS 606.96]|uniref:Zn(2)-C6 fungal-type domain-containing protein n=1 Tax=Capronia epimyces CBS 606.96 TaxID=1182542 RepID=W9Y2G9_9EURO|nr:uncharacterized protein A1O3_03954 [Capronia epimyces CBS 606.96]EXJ86997.1 hypothetical protein A1O3_03954 [Capronia epimyces CBS 606.96]
MAAPPLATDLFRTRNGRMKACEPCRRRKTACDHTLPICTQCIQRNAPQYCVYMLPRTSAFQSNNPTLASTDMPDAFANSVQAGVSSNGPSVTSTTAGSALQTVGQFFGSTSFLAAFDEKLYSPVLTQPREMPMSISSSDFEIDPSFSIDPDLLPLATKILAQFPDDRTCQILFERYNNLNDEIIRPSIARVMKSFWLHFGEELRQGKVSSIRKIATLISYNTSHPMEDDEDGLERWMKSSSLQTIRWESIGIILSHLSYGIISSGGEDLFLVEQEGSEKDRERILKQMRECVGNCIKLCRAYAGNTLLAYLIYKHLILEGIVNGDTSPTVWMLHGELISTVTTMGMHIESKRSQARTDLSIEMRRRVFSSIFIMDKILATFTGRPPLLSHRFTSTLLPLDISDEALLAGDDSIAASVASLDDGWSTNGMFHPSGMLRARRSLATIRSEILDEALGQSSLYKTNRDLLELRQRSKQLYSTLPSVFVHRLEDYTMPEKPMSENFARFNLRLEYLYSMFLLEKLISKHQQSSGQEVFDICREILSLVLLFGNQKERFIEVSTGVSWMILNFAIPASGTLCTELLRQTRSTSTSQGPGHYAWIPRSETIHNLSMLVTFLDWIPSSAPNATVCQRLRQNISDVLDQLEACLPAEREREIMLPDQSITPLDMYDFEAWADFTNLDYLGDLNSVDLFNWIT